MHQYCSCHDIEEPVATVPSPCLSSQLHAIGVLCELMPSCNIQNHDTELVKRITAGITPVPFEGALGVWPLHHVMPHFCHVMSYDCHVISHDSHVTSYDCHVISHDSHVISHDSHVISHVCHVMALPPSLADATRDPMEDEGKKLIEILSSPQDFQTAYLVRTALFPVQHSVSIPYMSN